MRINNSLLANVGQFLDEQIVQGVEEFGAETVVQALSFTVRNNDMFDIQYDIETPPKDTNAKESNVDEHKVGAFNVGLRSEDKDGQHGRNLRETHKGDRANEED